jgi:hypothetical protein
LPPWLCLESCYRKDLKGVDHTIDKRQGFSGPTRASLLPWLEGELGVALKGGEWVGEGIICLFIHFMCIYLLF